MSTNSTLTSTTDNKEMKRSKSFTFFRPKKTLKDGFSKSHSFKRISGLLKVESRKDRRAKKEALKAQSSTTGITYNRGSSPSSSVARTDEDAETIYGVDVEDGAKDLVDPPSSSLITISNLQLKNQSVEDDTIDNGLTVTIPTQTSPPLKVVLLLMDPVTRRFELLQLEFDSSTAIVKDVLAQIPHSVTEDALRQQTYKGIADRHGSELILSLQLSAFCTGSEILVAIPDGMPTKECARLSRPILSDEKVISMLRSSGIETPKYVDVSPPTPTAVRELPAPKEESKAMSPRDLPALSVSISLPPTVVKKEVPSRKSSLRTSTFHNIFTMLLVALLAFGAQVSHFYVSSPLKRGQRLSPGSVITKCGLLFFMPECKNNASVEMSVDGTMTMYGADKSIQWQIVGGVCDSFEKGCMNGAMLNEDGSLVIGGHQVSIVTVMGSEPLAPWPFSETPNLRTIRERK